ncbi:DUF2975 domain-containing protein [Liquorilactobacillus capillatus]|uniref:DUF2975 domain-containing protein n=1 Tax=Liquorilactobacillus capillatus DSM 19910 TaxID=1423731 RepID=A0A0R1M9Z8_9LACO|nr:DUF2975 domain-containing protein [Liquorilactobacillus capillatus]KRL00819.1 hypothetical protein FC81_GL001652 [Liquorilactobacillus capillatus DSM 19910]
MKHNYKKIIRCLNVFTRIILAFLGLAFIGSVFYVVDILSGNIKENLINDDSMFILQGHTVVADSAIRNFPRVQYALSFICGISLMFVGAYIALRAVQNILQNVLKGQVFNLKNAQNIKQIVWAQIWLVCSDPFLFWTNHLTETHLGRSSNTFQSSFIGDSITLLVIYVVYIAFKMAVDLKKENSLTI